MSLPQSNVHRHDGRKRALITLADGIGVGGTGLETAPEARASPVGNVFRPCRPHRHHPGPAARAHSWGWLEGLAHHAWTRWPG
jgi:hypothetical protein